MNEKEAMKIIEEHCPNWPNCSNPCDDCRRLSMLIEYGFTDIYGVVVDSNGVALEDKKSEDIYERKELKGIIKVGLIGLKYKRQADLPLLLFYIIVIQGMFVKFGNVYVYIALNFMVGV